MSQRYCGRSCHTLLRKLPPNLVVFDGHCLMCQARVQYVLERNFSYFNLLNLSQAIDTEKLEKNKILFCSFDSIEWREIRRHLPHLLTGSVEGILLLEKIPSKKAAFLGSVRKSTSCGTPNGSCSLPSPGIISNSGGIAEDDVDLLVSSKYAAVCRVGMKLDRWFPRIICWCLHYVLPRWIGDRWYDCVLARRRLWGTSEEDAVRHPKRVLGLKERTWKLRHM